MAEGIFKEYIRKYNLDIQVSSAGISAFDGDKASDNSVAALKKIGIDISMHKSRLVHDGLLNDAELILTMSKFHKEILINKYPNIREKVFLLNEYAFNDIREISDPYGGSLEDYERARDHICKAVEQIVEKIGKK